RRCRAGEQGKRGWRRETTDTSQTNSRSLLEPFGRHCRKFRLDDRLGLCDITLKDTTRPVQGDTEPVEHDLVHGMRFVNIVQGEVLPTNSIVRQPTTHP